MKKIIIVFAFLAFAGAACTKSTNTQQNTGTQSTGTNEKSVTQSANQPDLLLKSIGVELGTFDPATGKAGDFVFTKKKLTFDRLWMDYGFVIPGDQAAGGKDKANPQPTFLLPLGTKVRSLVDGVVVGVPQLYSKDYSVMVASSKDSSWIYETEHVINPVVKVGDTVQAGQVVAEVSTWDSQTNHGLGLVEIGILHGGNPPEHVCPFAYLDPSVKAIILGKITNFYAAWEEYLGNDKIYSQGTMPIAGCQTQDAIPG